MHPDSTLFLLQLTRHSSGNAWTSQAGTLYCMKIKTLKLKNVSNTRRFLPLLCCMFLTRSLCALLPFALNSKLLWWRKPQKPRLKQENTFTSSELCHNQGKKDIKSERDLEENPTLKHCSGRQIAADELTSHLHTSHQVRAAASWTSQRPTDSLQISRLVIYYYLL